jgi:hypothetical protein
MAKPPVDSTSEIVKAAIYPPIGIARVGNSENEYFLAPEVLIRCRSRRGSIATRKVR